MASNINPTGKKFAAAVGETKAARLTQYGKREKETSGGLPGDGGRNK